MRQFLLLFARHDSQAASTGTRLGQAAHLAQRPHSRQRAQRFLRTFKYRTFLWDRLYNLLNPEGDPFYNLLWDPLYNLPRSAAGDHPGSMRDPRCGLLAGGPPLQPFPSEGPLMLNRDEAYPSARHYGDQPAPVRRLEPCRHG